jgi:hypothetical protein
MVTYTAWYSSVGASKRLKESVPVAPPVTSAPDFPSVGKLLELDPPPSHAANVKVKKHETIQPHHFKAFIRLSPSGD